MTQTSPTAPTDAPETPQRKVTTQRVGVIGTPLAYQRDCVWPQPEIQLHVVDNELAIWNLTELIRVAEGAPSLTSEARADLARFRDELRACEGQRPRLRKLVEDKGGGVAPVFATVGDVFVVAGNGDQGLPAMVEVVGRAFGEWKDAKQAPMAKFPASIALFEEHWPMEDLVPHLQKIAESAAEDDEEDGSAEPSAQQRLETQVATSLLELVEGGAFQMSEQPTGNLVVVRADAMAVVFEHLTALAKARAEAKAEAEAEDDEETESEDEEGEGGGEE